MKAIRKVSFSRSTIDVVRNKLLYRMVAVIHRQTSFIGTCLQSAKKLYLPVFKSWNTRRRYIVKQQLYICICPDRVFKAGRDST